MLGRALLLMACAAAAARAQTDATVLFACPCIEHEQAVAAETQLRVNQAVYGAIAASSCIRSSIGLPGNAVIDVLWLRHLSEQYGAGGCERSGCDFGGMPSGGFVVLPLPWSIADACGEMPALAAAVLPAMRHDVKYATVHPVLLGLYSLPGAADFAAFDITEISPNALRGVFVPPLPQPNVVRNDDVFEGDQRARSFTMGYCATSPRVRDAVMEVVAAVRAGDTLRLSRVLQAYPTDDWNQQHVVSVLEAANFTTLSVSVCQSSSQQHIAEVAANAEFFLCPSDLGSSCDLLTTSMRYGAIPVLISPPDGEPDPAVPYKHHLPWKRMAVMLNAKQLENMEYTLSIITASQRKRMRNTIRAYWRSHFSMEGIVSQIAAWFTARDYAALEVITSPYPHLQHSLRVTARCGNDSATGEIPPGVPFKFGAVSLMAIISQRMPLESYDQNVVTGCLNHVIKQQYSSPIINKFELSTIANVTSVSHEGTLYQRFVTLLRLFERTRRDLMFALMKYRNDTVLHGTYTIDTTMLATFEAAMANQVAYHPEHAFWPVDALMHQLVSAEC